MSSELIILLVAAPMAAGILTTLLRGWVSAQRLVGILSISACLGFCAYWLWAAQGGAIIVTQIGAWKAPYGITIAFDQLSGLMMAAANLVALACYLHSFSSLSEKIERDWFHPLFHLLMMGVNYSFLTGDLFNLFVAFEIVLMASYALLCLGGTHEQLTQAYKYVMLNLIGSTFFVLGAGLVYGMMGTLNYADLARMVAAAHATGQQLPAGFQAVAFMLLFVFALKAAVFPLWFWLPDTYHTCPISIAAMFGALLTKIGIYAILRTFPMIFAVEPGLGVSAMQVLAFGAAVTMVLAILGAVAMRTIRRILGLTLIAHIGYLAFGVALMTPVSMAATLFYMIQHMTVMAALFLCCGLIEQYTGTDDLRRIGGLHQRAPWLSVMFLVVALSLAGIPPLSGFYGKLLIIQEGFVRSGDSFWMLSAAALVTSVLTLMAMAKIWALAFWLPLRGERTNSDGSVMKISIGKLAPAYAGVATLTVAALLIAIGAQPLMNAATNATASLSKPELYVRAVMGESAWQDAVADASNIAADVHASNETHQMTAPDGSILVDAAHEDDVAAEELHP